MSDNMFLFRMRGILSEGMIMCAATLEKSEIIEVPSSLSIGDRVTCDQYPGLFIRWVPNE